MSLTEDVTPIGKRVERSVCREHVGIVLVSWGPELGASEVGLGTLQTVYRLHAKAAALQEDNEAILLST